MPVQIHTVTSDATAAEAIAATNSTKLLNPDDVLASISSAGAIRTALDAVVAAYVAANPPAVTAADQFAIRAGTGTAAMVPSVFKTAAANGLEYPIKVIAPLGGLGVFQCTAGATGSTAALTGQIDTGVTSGMPAVTGINNSGTLGAGVYGVTGPSNGGAAVYGANFGGAGTFGSAVLAEYRGAGNGYALNARSGEVAASVTNRPTAIIFSGNNGTRQAALQADITGANTTYGIHTNGGIFTASGVTTSDRRVKRGITPVAPDAAEKLLDAVGFHTFTKLIDARALTRSHEERAERYRQGVAEVTRELAVLKDKRQAGEGRKAAEAPEAGADAAQLDAVEAALGRQLAELEELAAVPLVTDDTTLTLGMQAGVIAQDLQDLTKSIGAFEWLVRRSDPADEQSILVVDYESLYAILFAGMQSKLAAQAARLSALEGGAAKPAARKAA